jgi:hypothetical protein
LDRSDWIARYRNRTTEQMHSLAKCIRVDTFLQEGKGSAPFPKKPSQRRFKLGKKREGS